MKLITAGGRIYRVTNSRARQIRRAVLDGRDPELDQDTDIGKIEYDVGTLQAFMGERKSTKHDNGDT